MDAKIKHILCGTLLREAYYSPTSHFYKNLFSSLGFKPPRSPDQLDMTSIPLTTKKILVTTPLTQRLYVFGKRLLKIVYDGDAPFLVAQTPETLRKEKFGFMCERPLVCFSSLHEKIEKGLWFYTRNILPIISEENMDLTARIAKRYAIDSLITDTASLKNLLPFLQEQRLFSSIKKIKIIDTHFDMALLKNFSHCKEWYLTLALPEMGVCAEACPRLTLTDTPIFHPTEDSIVEIGNSLIVTKLILLPTPIIRYKTDIQGNKVASLCACGAEDSFTLHI